jgi:hypothetical protein
MPGLAPDVVLRLPHLLGSPLRLPQREGTRCHHVQAPLSCLKFKAEEHR